MKPTPAQPDPFLTMPLDQLRDEVKFASLYRESKRLDQRAKFEDIHARASAALKARTGSAG